MATCSSFDSLRRLAAFQSEKGAKRRQVIELRPTYPPESAFPDRPRASCARKNPPRAPAQRQRHTPHPVPLRAQALPARAASPRPHSRKALPTPLPRLRTEPLFPDCRLLRQVRRRAATSSSPAASDRNMPGPEPADVGHQVFRSRISASQSYFPFHSRLVAFKEGDVVSLDRNVRDVQFCARAAR